MAGMLSVLNSKRNVGPEKSVVPIQKPMTSSTDNNNYDNTGNKNEDNLQKSKDRLNGGPKSTEIRPIFIKTGVVPQASGSAYFESGNTKLICSVHGPRQSSSSHKTYSSSSSTSHDQANLNCEFNFSPFSHPGKRKEYPQDTQAKYFGLILQHALAPAIRLELFPKSSIDVHVQVLDCDGTLASLAGSITCASAAIVDAGIDMLDTVVAASAGLFENDLVALDCNSEEESLQTGSILISYMPSLNMVTHFIQNGECGVSSSVKTMDLCLDACAQIHNIIYKAIVNSAFGVLQ